MAHELGHNFGVHHANSLQLHGQRHARLAGGERLLARASTATRSASWAARSTRQFPAFHKGELGWLQPTSTYTVTSSGTYTIAASELDTAATQLLRIPRTGGALYVDVRQPYGTYFDNFLPGSEPVSGVMLRVGPATYNRTQPTLVDATPGHGDVSTTPRSPSASR